MKASIRYKMHDFIYEDKQEKKHSKLICKLSSDEEALEKYISEYEKMQRDVENHKEKFKKQNQKIKQLQKEKTINDYNFESAERCIRNIKWKLREVPDYEVDPIMGAIQEYINNYAKEKKYV